LEIGEMVQSTAEAAASDKACNRDLHFEALVKALEDARVHVEDAYNYSDLASKEGAAAYVALEVIRAALAGAKTHE